MELLDIERRRSRGVKVGAVTIGADAPVSVQSMTNTRTADVEPTVAQIQVLADAGADLVRVATPTQDDTAALPEIISCSPVPIIADVHFHFERALEAIAAGVPKIRLNPGNITDRDQVIRVIHQAGDSGTAIRVGVNEGSVVERTNQVRRQVELARPLHELMVEKLGEYLEIFHAEDFHNLVLSAKSHDALTCIATNRRLAEMYEYPLHLGVTHAGTAQTGAIRSAGALGALLSEGIGDTIRISYAGDPVDEVRDAVELLCSLRLRRRNGVELIACPTCGRVQMDIVPILKHLQEALVDVKEPITVAVMGCVVNGPGEADSADVAICAGKGRAVLYRCGKRIRTVSADQIVNAVVSEVHSLLNDKRNR